MHPRYEELKELLESKARWALGREDQDATERNIAYAHKIINMDPVITEDHFGGVSDRIGVLADGTIIFVIHKDGTQEIRNARYPSATDRKKINEYLKGYYLGSHRGYAVLWGDWYGNPDLLVTDHTVMIRPDGTVDGARSFDDVWDKPLYKLIDKVESHWKSYATRFNKIKSSGACVQGVCLVCERHGKPWRSDLEWMIAHSNARRTCNRMMPGMPPDAVMHRLINYCYRVLDSNMRPPYVFYNHEDQMANGKCHVN